MKVTEESSLGVFYVCPHSPLIHPELLFLNWLYLGYTHKCWWVSKYCANEQTNNALTHTQTYLNLFDGGSITVAYLLTKRGPFVKPKTRKNPAVKTKDAINFQQNIPVYYTTTLSSTGISAGFFKSKKGFEMG